MVHQRTISRLDYFTTCREKTCRKIVRCREIIRLPINSGLNRNLEISGGKKLQNYVIEIVQEFGQSCLLTVLQSHVKIHNRILRKKWE